MLPAELVDAGLFGSMPRYGDLCMHAVVDLRRTFARAELERALAATIGDFPVLGRCYEPRFWRDRWVPVESPLAAAVHVVEEPGDLEAETARWARRSMDTTRERPVRIVSLGRRTGSRLVVSVSHLAVDGAGMAAVGHVLGSHLYGVAPAAPVDRRRDLARALAKLRWFHLPVLARDVVGTLLRPLRTVAAARRERPYAASTGPAPVWRHLVVSADELATLRARCGGASVNDLLLAAVARIAADRAGPGEVAVHYTMDLRRYGAPRFTAANTSSILTAFVPRKALGTLEDAAAAVASITARHRQGLAGPAFVLTPVALALGTPHGVLRRMVRAIHPVAVDLPLSRGLIVTNVGRLDDGLEAFGADVEHVAVIGPNLHGVPVPAIVAYGFRGALCLELFAAPSLGAAALDELERELVVALERG
ncbi:MAG: hypothetical protein HY908_36185 [Myxococcales bacterium]|nr:hypothetical protein [Myxococcales bacterium]